MRITAVFGALAAIFCLVTATAGATPIGIPTDGGLGFQPAATPVMEQIDSFHNMMLWIITAISLVVLALLAYVVVRYRAKANPDPSKVSHNTLLEVVWTAIPVIILVVIAIPSFRLLYFQDVIPEADFTIKTTGWQWNWEYEYPDHGGFTFFSNMTADEDIDNVPYVEYRNLSTDLPVVVPTGATVRVEVTAADVIHNWAMPSFGVKMDAIPGRLNETWFRADIEGIYYGQCSELCGIRHAFMPIEVHVVPQDVFDAWVAASNEDPYTGPDVLAAYYESNASQRVAAAQ